MASVNVQYPQLLKQPVARFERAIISGVSGRRLNPQGLAVVEFLIQPNDPSDYDEAILELYSDEELAVFKRLNRPLFEQGLLVPFEGDRTAVGMVNIMTDAQIEEVISQSLTIKDIGLKVQPITSVFTLDRFIKIAVEMGKTSRYVKVIEDRKKELEDVK